MLLSLPYIVLNEKYAIQRGPFGGSLKKEIFKNEGYLVYEQFHAINDDFSMARYFIDDKKYQEMFHFKVKPHDMIISCSGATLGRIAQIPENALEGIINQALLKISLNPQIINYKYFKFLFRSDKIQNIIFGISRGTGMPNFPSLKEIKSILFPIPPLNEQERIVAKIEELFSLVDSIKQLLENIKNQLKQYQQSLLKSTFEGEFVKELQMSKFADICKKITDGEHLKPKFLDSGVPFLSAKNITKLGLSFEDVKYVSNVDAENFRKKCEPKLNDILMVSRGNVGRTCMVNTNNPFCLLGSVILLQLKSNIDSKYVLYFLKTSSNLKKLTRISSSTVQGAIYLQDLKQLTIPIHSLNEQKIIVEKIEGSFSLIEKNKKLVDLLLFQNNYMKNSILKQAFEGTLLPQDPNDEPASELLKRIKLQI